MGEEEFYNDSSDNWNIAPGYVNLEILIPILNFGKYRRIAKFGTHEMEMGQIPYDLKVSLRVEAVDRMIEELDILISNCVFACKKDRPKFQDQRDRLNELSQYKDGIRQIYEDQIAKRTNIEINEDFFNYYSKELIDIKEKVVSLANENHLIFPQSQFVTKDDIFNRVTQRG